MSKTTTAVHTAADGEEVTDREGVAIGKKVSVKYFGRDFSYELAGLTARSPMRVVAQLAILGLPP